MARAQLPSVPVKPRRAHILSPAGDAQLSAGQALILRGGGYSPDFGLGSPDAARWTSSIDGVLGRGFEMLAKGQSTGTHQVSLEVPDGLGGTSQARTVVTVQAQDRPEPAPDA